MFSLSAPPLLLTRRPPLSLLSSLSYKYLSPHASISTAVVPSLQQITETPPQSTTDSAVPQISLMTLNGLKSLLLSSFRPKTGQPMSQILIEIVAIIASRIFSGSDQLWEEVIDYVYVSITGTNITQEVQEMGFMIQGSNVSLTHFLSL